MKMIRNTFVAACMVLFATSAFANDYSSWMINADFTMEDGQEMKLSLPITFLKSFEPQIREALSEVDLEGQEVNFQEIWQAVKESGDNEYVTVESDDADIRVAVSEGNLVVNVNDKNEGQTIDVTIPMAFGDILFGGDLANLDMDAVIDALGDIEGNLIEIVGNEVNGRVWITR